MSSLISAVGRLYGSASYSDGLLINLYDFSSTMALVVSLVISMIYEERSTLDSRSVCVHVIILTLSHLFTWCVCVQWFVVLVYILL